MIERHLHRELQEQLLGTARWRSNMADRFPSDPRNARAAALASALLADLSIDPRLEERWTLALASIAASPFRAKAEQTLTRKLHSLFRNKFVFEFTPRSADDLARRMCSAAYTSML